MIIKEGLCVGGVRTSRKGEGKGEGDGVNMTQVLCVCVCVCVCVCSFTYISVYTCENNILKPVKRGRRERRRLKKRVM
jgi:hypothetical protein